MHWNILFLVALFMDWIFFVGFCIFSCSCIPILLSLTCGYIIDWILLNRSTGQIYFSGFIDNQIISMSYFQNCSMILSFHDPEFQCFLSLIHVCICLCTFILMIAYRIVSLIVCVHVSRTFCFVPLKCQHFDYKTSRYNATYSLFTYNRLISC